MGDARDAATRGRPLATQNERLAIADPDLLEMRGIVKRYGRTSALDGVDFAVRAGEIHALLGENGAGKSTLMHVLSGLTRADSGSILVEGAPAHVPNPRAARRLGISMVHQHFALVPAFTIAENLALDSSAGGKRLGFSAIEASAPALERAASLGWKLDPNVPVSELSVGTQQRVEIVKALATDARLLIFDEPTAVLSADEVDELFRVLRRLRDEGNGVILIAHKLAEILAVADRVTVLRRGRNVADAVIAETDAKQLAAWMIGGEVEAQTQFASDTATKPAVASDPVGFSAKGVAVTGDRHETILRDVSLSVLPGEIYGIGGVDGNGQTELAETLIGLRVPASGAITWRGQAFVAGESPSLGYIPQDRRRVGLAVSMTVEENLLFDAVRSPRFRFGPFLMRKALRELAATLIRDYDIRASGMNMPASSLSGGNQQKIVVARALHSHPDWIVAVNPTRGLDVGAAKFVHERLKLARARGAAIVFISTDFDEIRALADRTAILSGGRLTEFEIAKTDDAELGLLLGGLAPSAPPVVSAEESP